MTAKTGRQSVTLSKIWKWIALLLGLILVGGGVYFGITRLSQDPAVRAEIRSIRYRITSLFPGDHQPPSSQPVIPVSSSVKGPLRVDPANPRYFTDGSGQAILLVGDHTWYTLQDGGPSNPPPTLNYTAYLDFLQANHINFFRLFVWEQARCSELVGCGWYYDPLPYARTGPGNGYDGKPKFNLSQFNQAYFDRLRERVILAGQRGIYVSIQLFDGFSVVNKGYGPSPSSPWPGHPFNTNNNINSINGDPNKNGQGEETETLDIPAITALQDAYVKKVIDTVNDLDNVLYEICNESNGGADYVAWQNHMIDLIHSYEAGKPKQHPVGFTVPWPGGNNAELFASHADWISPNADGGYFDNPPAADGKKIVITDTDHLCYPCGDRAWVWKSVTRGYNPAFMDPYDCRGDPSPGGCNPNDPKWVSLRLNLGYALSYSKRVNLELMRPLPKLASSGYILANPTATGAAYLVYSPTAGNLTVDLTASPGVLSVEWLNPADGTTKNGGTLNGGAVRSFTTPFPADAVLFIYQAGTTITPPPCSATPAINQHVCIYLPTILQPH